MLGIKRFLRDAHWILADQLGIDPIKFVRFFGSLPWFFYSAVVFRKKYNGLFSLRPCLHDKRDQAGSASNEYFIQDLLVAQLINQDNPLRHLDVGSRVDGFVAHVASFRDIDVMDVRPLTSTCNRIRFVQHDLMTPIADAWGSSLLEQFDSISCLHALEHFGLGRYGDPLNVEGWSQGLSGMFALLQSGGKLYLSSPVGRERVSFNANWVFSPRAIIDFAEKLGLRCERLYKISSGSPASLMDVSEAQIRHLEKSDYTLCLFVFRKNGA